MVHSEKAHQNDVFCLLPHMLNKSHTSYMRPVEEKGCELKLDSEYYNVKSFRLLHYRKKGSDFIKI
jgi:hypothetical protein